MLIKLFDAYINPNKILTILRGGPHISDGCTIIFKGTEPIRFHNKSPDEVMEEIKRSRQLPQKKTIINEIKAERSRQITEELYTHKRDDNYTQGELSLAAACYASPIYISTPFGGKNLPVWPWLNGMKRKTRREDLVRAAALIVAEIERLDRKSAKVPE